jgi:hypothetical protein
MPRDVKSARLTAAALRRPALRWRFRDRLVSRADASSPKPPGAAY